MDPYAAALGVQASAPKLSPVAGIVTPDQQQPDNFDGSPADIANLKRQLAKTTDPAARADLQNALVKKTGGGADPYAAALGVAPPEAPRAVQPVVAQPPGPHDSSVPVPLDQQAPKVDNQPSWWQKSLAAVEAGANTVAGAVGGAAGTVYGGLEGLGEGIAQGKSPTEIARGMDQRIAQRSQQFTPELPQAMQTQLGKDYTAKTADFIATNAPAMGGLGAELSAMGNSGAALKTAAGDSVAAKMAPAPVVNRVEPVMAKPRYQLIDGKPALIQPEVATPTPTPTLAQASPELQKVVAAAGSQADPTVVARHVEADTLPIPVKLTKGQATVDPDLISKEMNGRGKEAPIVSPEFYKQQGQAIAQNMDAIRASAAPDVPATASLVDHGQTLLDSYKKMDEPVKADISAKYKALEDAAGGNFPIDGQTFVANSEAALDKALKAGSVPADIQSSLNAFKSGRQMTFQDFESLRSDLADVQRTATDGRQRAAAGIIRQQLEDLPLPPEAAALKPLADEARKAAAARFSAIKSDPAYRAAVEDSAGIGEPSALADKFFNAYVTKGARSNVATMRAHLADDPLANQTIAAGTIDQLAAQLKADPETGNFRSATYNKALEGLSPKLDSLLDAKTAQQVQALGNTAKLAQTQPRGAYVNNSNTAVALAGSLGKKSVELGVNALFGGVPVGTVGMAAGGKIAGGIGARNAAKNSLAPGAGITKVSEFPR